MVVWDLGSWKKTIWTFFLRNWKRNFLIVVVFVGPWTLIITPFDLHVLTHNYWKIYSWFVFVVVFLDWQTFSESRDGSVVFWGRNVLIILFLILKTHFGKTLDSPISEFTWIWFFRFIWTLFGF